LNATKVEIEVKFWLRDLPAFERRLQQMGATLDHARVYEVNLRFDLPDGSLSRAGKVLRLRKDHSIYFTYKEPAEIGEGVSMRHETEVDIADFDQGRSFLEALGYRVAMTYEKYRTGYRFRDLMVTLDEMPFGTLCEIEAPDAASLKMTAETLGLDWETRSIASYLQLFEVLNQKRGLQLQNLSFAELSGFTFNPADVGMRPADG
jgi:predicted adenylyl cyclase CyaB